MHGFREVEAMPIYLLGPLVVCGIILVVLLVRALFNQRPRELSDRRDIETLFLMAFPETLIVEPVLIGGAWPAIRDFRAGGRGKAFWTDQGHGASLVDAYVYGAWRDSDQ